MVRNALYYFFFFFFLLQGCENCFWIADGTCVRTGSHLQKVVFASYPETASIFAVVATVRYPSARQGGGGSANSSSVVYVGSATYGCVLGGADDGADDDVVVGMQCDAAWNWIEVMAMTFAVVIGLWLCLLGRHYFALSHVAYGFLSGAALGCLAAEAISSVAFGFKVVVVVAVGIVGECGQDPYRLWYPHTTISFMFTGGVLWLSQWLLLGWPRLSLVLPGLMAGAVPAGAMLFSPAMNTETFTYNGAFWSTAFGTSCSSVHFLRQMSVIFTYDDCFPFSPSAISAGLASLLVLFPRQASVACSVVLGAVLLTLAGDYAITGGALKFYLVVNFVRRAAGVDGGDFAWAVTGFPLQV